MGDIKDIADIKDVGDIKGVTDIRGTAESRRERFTETIREGAGRQADSARRELGEIVIDATDEYFPEAVRKRRRRDVASGFVVGLMVGFLVRYAFGER